ncbi:MAG: hypothetical protein V4669_01285 [Pseudomonadota bacterium]
MTKRWGSIAALGLAIAAGGATAFQLAPMGSRFEARLTNETPNWLAAVAGKVGVLLKEPVHEEITQLAYGCPIDPSGLPTDKGCMGGDHGFANHFVIYGVRWNDLPPFMLQPGEGARCKKVLNPLANACNVGQTVRFSTQPDCWYCLFKEAQEKAARVKITGCQKGLGHSRGNLMTRSHFGDLQFLHAMANEEAVPPEVTRQKIIEWAEFTWKIAEGKIKPGTQLRTINIPVIQEHFGCSEWTVADIYILGRNPQLLPYVQQIAFGSLLHTVQDSFAAGHAQREESAPGGICPASDFPHPPRLIEFHGYAQQDGHAHDRQDAREALVGNGSSDWPAAVAATRHLVTLRDAGLSWEQVKPAVECLFALVPEARPSGPGEMFTRVPS